jgi:hypothetical protein
MSSCNKRETQCDFYNSGQLKLINYGKNAGECYYLEKGKHPSTHLQNSYKKHTSAVFSYNIIEFVDDKDKLIARLREYFDETSRKARLERRKDEAEFAKSELNNVPMTIYIG